MKVLAIDPGYGRLGWAVGEVENRHLKVIDFDCLETNAKAKLGERYQEISATLQNIIETEQPQVLALEKLYFARNTTTALKVSEARGLAIATCLPKVNQIIEFSPSEIKSTVAGHGSANKEALKKMTLLQLKIDPKTPEHANSKTKFLDDAIDALAILLTFSSSHSVLLNQSNHAIL